MNLLKDIQQERDLSFLFISHDLGVVRQVADTIAVMYLGRIVEFGRADAIFDDPKHPYTQALLSAVPEVSATNRRSRAQIIGDPPSPTDIPPGCAFAARCPIAVEECTQVRPELMTRASRLTACHLVEDTQGVLHGSA